MCVCVCVCVCMYLLFEKCAFDTNNRHFNCQTQNIIALFIRNVVKVYFLAFIINAFNIFSLVLQLDLCFIFKYDHDVLAIFGNECVCVRESKNKKTDILMLVNKCF